MDRVEKVQGLRRGNAAGPHQDKRTKRVRDRGSAKRAAIRDELKSHRPYKAC